MIYRLTRYGLVVPGASSSNPWPNLQNTGPGSIGITSFTDSFALFGLNPHFTSADYGLFPTTVEGGVTYHLIEGYDMINTGTIFFDSSDHWLIRGCNLYGSSTGGGGYGINFGQFTTVSNSLLKYCRITGTDNLPYGTISPQTGGVNVAIAAGGADTLEIAFNQMYNFAQALSEPDLNCNVHDNFMSQPRDDGVVPNNDHSDGVQTHGTTNFTFNHNWVDNRLTQTSCIQLNAAGPGGSTGIHTNVAITNNFFAMNGAYYLYAGDQVGGVGGHVATGTFTGNRFSNKYGQPRTAYISNQPSSGVNGSTNITWSDNQECNADGTALTGYIVP